jgi:hypothetical protein
MARLLDRPYAARFVVLAAILLSLPSLAAGFFSDDWFMLAALRRRWPLAPAWWDLYDFTPQTDAETVRAIANGWLPWWTAPSLRLHLLRPLSSALLALDERISADFAPGWHLHSIVWWAALLVLLAALYRRVLPGRTGTLALIVFAVVPANAMTYGWISSRHMLVSAVPCFAALLMHLKAREDGWRPGKWLAPLGPAVGLAGGESALGGVTFWLAYEAFGPARLGGRRERALAATPAFVIALLYFALYRVAGGVVEGSGAYVSPMRDPVTFAAIAPMRFVMLLANALLELPVEASLGHASWPFVLAGLGATGLCFFLWRVSRDLVSADERAALRWLLPGALLAVLGTCGGIPGGRALLIANLGFSPLLAVLVRRGWERGAKARLPRFAAGFLAVIHFGLAPLLGVVGDLAATVMASQTLTAARALPSLVHPARRVFLLEASDPMVSIYVQAILMASGGSGLDCVARLTSRASDHRVTRLDERTLAIEPVGGPMLVGPFEVLYRSNALPFQPGDEIPICGAGVRVAGVDAGRPTRIEVRFAEPLDAPSQAMVAWDGSGFSAVHFALGETRVLPWRPGPMRNQ